jgi:hypothetical protein
VVLAGVSAGLADRDSPAATWSGRRLGFQGFGFVAIRLRISLRRYGRGVRWSAGEKVIAFLLERGRLESVAADVEEACNALLERAAKRLATARAAAAGEDWEGAFRQRL